MIGVVCRIGVSYGMTTGDDYIELSPETVGEHIMAYVQTASTEDAKGRPGRSVLYVQDLDLIGGAILTDLVNIGYKDSTDITEWTRQTPKGSYQTTIGAEMGTWYSICIYRYDGYSVGIYSLENVTGQQTNATMLKNRRNNESDIHCITRVAWGIIEMLEGFTGGKTSLTLASWAMRRWTDETPIWDRADIYPDHYKVTCDMYSCTADEYVRNAYRGGWCYCKATPYEVYEDGITLDVNSLYSYVMKCHKFPTGKPFEWIGHMPDLWKKRVDEGRWMCIYHISCRYAVKDGYLPFLLVPGDALRHGVQSSSKIINSAGVIDDPVELWLTDWELKLFEEHYDISDMKVYDGVCYQLQRGLFSDYVDEYYTMKREARKSGDYVRLRVSKMMLNALSGGFAKRRDRVNLLVDPTGAPRGYIEVETKGKSLIPIGVCITSYARCYIVKICQKNYDRFLYSDTDSAHLLGTEPPAGIEIDGEQLGSMKVEREWDKAIFFGQKTYMEHTRGSGWSLVYAGVPSDVQGMMEETLDGFDHLKQWFGEIPTDIVIDSLSRPYRYEVEVPTGTYTVGSEPMVWKLDMSAKREQQRRAREKAVRAQNLKNKENERRRKKK